MRTHKHAYAHAHTQPKAKIIYTIQKKLNTTEGGNCGWRWSQSLAFLRHRDTVRWWISWWMPMEESSWAFRCEISLPITRTMWTVSSARPPSVSATTGTKSIPAALQFARWEDNFAGYPLGWHAPEWRQPHELSVVEEVIWCEHQGLQDDHYPRLGGEYLLV